MSESGLYVGTLRHRRFSPKPHDFTYRVFMPLLDIDRLPELMAVSRLTGYNRFNWASFHERDHLGDPLVPLRRRLADDAAAAGVRLPDGPVLLLTHLRYVGYVFNPVSFFYCFNAAGELAAVMAEVNNTCGGRQTHWLTDAQPTVARVAVGGAAACSYRIQKTLYVSPFMRSDVDWTFALSRPAESLVAHMTVADTAVIFDATLTMSRRPWSAASIRRALVRQPMMTAAVIAGIHWQALRLYLKGVPVVRRLTTDGVNERAAVERAAASSDAPLERSVVREIT